MIIGICGQSSSGKDTFADYLCKHYGFVKVAFADPLKRFVKEVFNFTDEQVWGPSECRNALDRRYLRVEPEVDMGDHVEKEWSTFLTPRYALQTLGTEWGRNCYKDVWVDYAIRVHSKLQRGRAVYDHKFGLIDANPVWPKTNIVISDVRFQNEVDGVRKAGGKVVKLIRKGATGNVGIAKHASEEEQKTIPDNSFNAIIMNLEGLDHLYQSIDVYMANNHSDIRRNE